MCRRPGSRRKRESGGRYQRFRTNHSDEPGPHSSICRSDAKGGLNNFSASRPFKLTFAVQRIFRASDSDSEILAQTGRNSLASDKNTANDENLIVDHQSKAIREK